MSLENGKAKKSVTQKVDKVYNQVVGIGDKILKKKNKVMLDVKLTDKDCTVYISQNE